jgi:hypothetical protein
VYVGVLWMGAYVWWEGGLDGWVDRRFHPSPPHPSIDLEAYLSHTHTYAPINLPRLPHTYTYIHAHAGVLTFWAGWRSFWTPSSMTSASVRCVERELGASPPCTTHPLTITRKRINHANNPSRPREHPRHAGDGERGHLRGGRRDKQRRHQHQQQQGRGEPRWVCMHMDIAAVCGTVDVSACMRACV